MKKKILEPTDQILCTIKILDDAIERLMQAVTILKISTKYESDVEIFNLLKLIVRHTESVLALAREDLILFPSAMVIARTAYEATIKLIWISYPDDPFNREIRWLAQLQTEEEYYSKMATRMDIYGSGNTSQKISETIHDFRVGVTEKIPEGYITLKKIPNISEMLDSFGEDRKYLLYLMGCQFTHNSHVATGLYRKNLGTAKKLGEFISAQDWHLCLSITWSALLGAGKQFIYRAGGDPSNFASAQFVGEVELVLNAINSIEQVY
jgi:Family of unknown function (DUF5677)